MLISIPQPITREEETNWKKPDRYHQRASTKSDILVHSVSHRNQVTVFPVL